MGICREIKVETVIAITYMYAITRINLKLIKIIFLKNILQIDRILVSKGPVFLVAKWSYVSKGPVSVLF